MSICVFRRLSMKMPLRYASRMISTSSPKVMEDSAGLAPAQTVQHKSIMDRMVLSAEVMVSKIFPAGFGWQSASIVADSLGYQATDMGFFLITGAGDLAGVFTGHTMYYMIKSLINPDVNVVEESKTGLFLGSAAFCSGFAWQPVVNALQATAMPCVGVMAGTTIGCGLAFFGGLRLFRTIYNPIGIPAGDKDNMVKDAQLSLAIGGATGAFVGTDVAYMDGAGNFLRPAVGIEEGMSDIAGCITAGSSTALGFAVFQTGQNVTAKPGTNWTD